MKDAGCFAFAAFFLESLQNQGHGLASHGYVSCKPGLLETFCQQRVGGAKNRNTQYPRAALATTWFKLVGEKLLVSSQARRRLDLGGCEWVGGC